MHAFPKKSDFKTQTSDFKTQKSDSTTQKSDFKTQNTDFNKVKTGSTSFEVDIPARSLFCY